MATSSQPAGNESQIRRHIMGVIGILLIVVGIVFWIYPPSTASQELLHGMCIKAGVVLVAGWLAYPQLARLPIWMCVSVIAIGMVVIARPAILPVLLRVGLYLSPVLFLIWLFRTKPKKKTEVRSQ